MRRCLMERSGVAGELRQVDGMVTELLERVSTVEHERELADRRSSSMISLYNGALDLLEQAQQRRLVLSETGSNRVVLPDAVDADRAARDGCQDQPGAEGLCAAEAGDGHGCVVMLVCESREEERVAEAARERKREWRMRVWNVERPTAASNDVDD